MVAISSKTQDAPLSTGNPSRNCRLDGFQFNDRHRPGPPDPRPPSLTGSGCVWATCFLAVLQLRLDLMRGQATEPGPEHVSPGAWTRIAAQVFASCGVLEALKAYKRGGSDDCEQHWFEDAVDVVTAELISFVWRQCMHAAKKASWHDANVAHVWRLATAQVEANPQWLAGTWKRLQSVAGPQHRHQAGTGTAVQAAGSSRGSGAAGTAGEPRTVVVASTTKSKPRPTPTDTSGKRTSGAPSHATQVPTAAIPGHGRQGVSTTQPALAPGRDEEAAASPAESSGLSSPESVGSPISPMAWQDDTAEASGSLKHDAASSSTGASGCQGGTTASCAPPKPEANANSEFADAMPHDGGSLPVVPRSSLFAARPSTQAASAGEAVGGRTDALKTPLNTLYMPSSSTSAPVAVSGGGGLPRFGRVEAEAGASEASSSTSTTSTRRRFDTSCEPQ